MNKEMLSCLTVSELKENIQRFYIANSDLSDLLNSLEEERAELDITKEMLMKTLSEIAPKEERLMSKVITRAKGLWSDLWKRETQSEDKDEWNKIMKELE